MKKGQKDGKLIVKLKRHFVSTRIIGIIHSILTCEVDLTQPYLIHIHISLLSQKWEEVRKNSAAKRMNLIASCTNVVFFSAFFSSDKWRRSYCRHDKNLTWLRIHSFFLRFSFTLACYTLRQKSTKIQNTEKC